ncbi:hypothetical protein B296_00009984 [Ensete ventricosum]|uniref:Uncharacterized protein n=1 Tax=Ensete ventricosum TaxID=4639 RepID=A0A426ZW20_ENSVE|nr:hypothetical protein B296_00009984 [Ensete ventricosum]
MESRTSTVSRKNFRLVFHAPYRKFKILVIPYVLAHGKLCEHDFVKKHDSQKFCIKSHVRSRVSIGFSCTVSEIQKTGHSQIISPSEVIRARFRENTHGHNFAQSHARSRVSIDFSCTVSKIQNTGHSQRISPMGSLEFRSVFRAPSRKFKLLAIPYVLAHGKSYEHGFRKNVTVTNFAQSRV